MKQTRQKTLILNQISNRDDHPTVEMIHKELLLIDPHISLATVYRNLNTYALKGKIKKIEIPNAKDRFDWTLIRHDHAICFKCGKINENYRFALIFLCFYCVFNKILIFFIF